ncbi:unnamed protein product, partial [Brachionus calyciflorus]
PNIQAYERKNRRSKQIEGHELINKTKVKHDPYTVLKEEKEIKLQTESSDIHVIG